MYLELTNLRNSSRISVQVFTLSSKNPNRCINAFFPILREYSSNFVAFDSHHMILINLLNTLYAVLQDVKDKERFNIERYIGIVDNFISAHFYILIARIGTIRYSIHIDMDTCSHGGFTRRIFTLSTAQSQNRLF